jgi:hypothetical protein
MAGFTFDVTSGDGRFHIGRKQSILSDGLEFTLTECVTGIWRDGAKVLNKDNGNSIRFKTSISDDVDDSININVFIGRRKVVYDENGRARVLYMFKDHDKFVKFLEEKIGRDSNNPNCLLGSAKEIGEKVLKEFFDTKKLVAKEEKNVFFKTIKDGVEKLEAPFDSIYTISFAE